MNVLIKLVSQKAKSMLEGFKLPFVLIQLFHSQTSIQYIRISTNVFFSKFINMAVMFMPLKLLFVLTGAKNIAILTEIEALVGRNNYIALVMFILSILYIFNAFLQVYRAKLVNRQKYAIQEKEYHYNEKILTSDSIKKTYPAFCQVIADMAVIAIVCLVIFVAEPLLALFNIIVIGFFSLIYEQWVFSKYETKLMKKLDVDKKIFIQAVSMIMFLVLFVGIIFVVLSTGMSALKAILLLLLMRLANGSFKSYLSCHIKLRECFL